MINLLKFWFLELLNKLICLVNILKYLIFLYTIKKCPVTKQTSSSLKLFEKLYTSKSTCGL